MRNAKKIILVLGITFITVFSVFSTDLSALFIGIDSEETPIQNNQTIKNEKEKLETTAQETQNIESSILPILTRNTSNIIEVTSIPGKFKDNIIIINKIDEMSQIKINAISNGNSILIGTAALRWFDDEVKFDSSKSLRFSDYKTFQIEPSNGKIYSYKAEKRNNDLIIEVRENGSDLSKSAVPKWAGNRNVFSFDLKSLKDEPDENVKILCNSFLGVGKFFKLYAYDSKNRHWILYGSLQINKQGKEENLKTEKGVEDLDDYRYFALETENLNSYKFNLEEKNDDLFITASN